MPACPNTLLIQRPIVTYPTQVTTLCGFMNERSNLVEFLSGRDVVVKCFINTEFPHRILVKTWPGLSCLRMFVPNFSNIDFSLEILPLKDDELVMSEM